MQPTTAQQQRQDATAQNRDRNREQTREAIVAVAAYAFTVDAILFAAIAATRNDRSDV